MTFPPLVGGKSRRETTNLLRAQSEKSSVLKNRELYSVELHERFEAHEEGIIFNNFFSLNIVLLKSI